MHDSARETLRLYASIFEKPWHDYKGGGPYPVPQSSLAAARALRFMADKMPTDDGAPDEIFTRAEWFALPLALRQKWWDATDYGRKPSPELAAELKAWLKAQRADRKD